MNDKDIIEVVQARIAGEPIQHRRIDVGPDVEWRDCSDQHIWMFDMCDYRVKQELRKFIIYGNSLDDLSTYVAPDLKEVIIKELKNIWTFVFEVTEEQK